MITLNYGMVFGALPVIHGVRKLFFTYSDEILYGSNSAFNQSQKQEAIKSIAIGFAIIGLSCKFSHLLPPLKPPGCQSLKEFNEVAAKLPKEECGIGEVIEKINKSPHGLQLLRWSQRFKGADNFISHVQPSDMSHSVMVGCDAQENLFIGLKHSCATFGNPMNSYSPTTSFYGEKGDHFAGILDATCRIFPQTVQQRFCDMFDSLLQRNWTHLVGVNGNPVGNLSLV